MITVPINEKPVLFINISSGGFMKFKEITTQLRVSPTKEIAHGANKVYFHTLRR